MILRSLLSCVLLLGSTVHAQTTAPIEIQRCLVIGPLGRAARQSALVDPIEATIVAGKWQAPHDGDELVGADGKASRWRSIESKDATFADDALRGGWAYVSIDAPAPRIMILAASGHTMVYVNREPRAGDVYEAGYVRLPIQLREGRNDLLFNCARGQLHVDLHAPRGPVVVEAYDPTLPDFMRGVPERQPMAALVTNATTQPVMFHDGTSNRQIIPPLSVRKVACMVDYDGRDAGFERLVGSADGSKVVVSGMTFKLPIVNPGQPHKRTYISDVDGSVQYYSIVPQQPPPKPGEKPALVLSLHGASVEAISQAGAYSAKSWAHIVCPTNRRPYGFDWEDWGRIDAMDVFERAQVLLDTDRSRTYLTGHSMGGHGVWTIGSLFPDRFAAIGPSAGWLSFSSYRDTPTTAPTTVPAGISELLRRAMNLSDTQSLMPNLAQLGVYILHGEDDDNVPFAQAQQAVKLLESFHHDVAMHAQPKAGHWWDASDEPGTDCVDWAPMFDFFARHRLPEDREVREVDFRTFNPGASSKCHWLAIDAQLKPMILSRVQMRCDPGAARFEGTTENVARMSIDLKRVPTTRPIKAKIDGVELTLDGHEQAWLYREGEIWEQGSPPEAEWKRAARTGPFKQAFSNHMVFVYGTHGTDEENTVAFNKARFDAETWWYRGNGSVDVVADKGWLPRPDGGNVIVYGNADTNSVWSLLLSDSPIQVKRGELQIADQKFTGDDLAAMFIRPRAGDGGALVAAIAGTGPAGMRLTNRIPIFASGVAVPDWIVFGPDVLQKGLRAARGAGYFANDWSIGSDNVISQD